jgi:hypothetical protein
MKEVDAAGRAAAREHAHAPREARARHEMVAEAMDEVLALRQSVVVAAEGLQVEIAATRVLVLAAPPEVDRSDLWIRPELRDQPLKARCYARVAHAAGPARIDDDLCRGDRALPDGCRENVKAPNGFQVARNSFVRAGPQLQREHGRCKREEHRRSARDEEDRPTHDCVRQPDPEVVLLVRASRQQPTRHQPDPIQAGSQVVEEHRQKRHRAKHRYGRDQEADAEAAHEGQRHEEE